MATTRIMPLHIGKGQSVGTAVSDILEYVKDAEKTDQSRLVIGIEELDGYALRELVSAIYVDALDKSSGKRVQHIHIKYDGLGFIPLNELMKKETA